MKSLAVVVPTYKRIQKLERLLKSLDQSIYKDYDIHIYCDNNDLETFNHEFTRNEFVCLNIDQVFSPGCWNRFFTTHYGANKKYKMVLWLCDDTEVLPDTLEKAVKCMLESYPDLDGVVGLRQECPNRPDYTFKWYGQVLLGRAFIERYKHVDYQVCCPSFRFLYQDEEIFMYASSLRKFTKCPEATIKHYHPAYIKTELDATHELSRTTEIREADRATFARRRSQNLIWPLA